MKYAVWVLILLLVVLHQDIWNWTDGRLVLGFMPVGLAYHVGLSIAATVVWLLAVRFAWPEEETGRQGDKETRGQGKKATE